MMSQKKVKMLDALGAELVPNGIYAYSNRDSKGGVTITIGKMVGTTDNGRVSLMVLRRSRALAGDPPERDSTFNSKSSIFANTLVPIQLKYLTREERKMLKSIPDVNIDDVELTLMVWDNGW